MGLFFHCYPHLSVHSLHLHVLDTRPECLGPTYDACRFKNVHINCVIKALEREWKELKDKMDPRRRGGGS